MNRIHSSLLTIFVLILFSCPSLARDEKQKDANQGFHERMVKSFQLKNKTVKPGGIVFVGDSITQGFPCSLIKADKPVYNRGISGDKIGNYYYGVLDRMKESVYDLKPSKVFLLIGINNFSYWKTPDEIMSKGYNLLLSQLKKNCPNTKIYVQSVLPLRGGWTKNNKRVLEVNEELKTLCKKYGHNYLNIHQYLVDKKGELKKEFTRDGLHLNLNGYITWIKHLPKLGLKITKNLTTNKPVEVSGGTEGEWSPQRAVDGITENLSGWWASPGPQWIKVDLEAIYNLKRVKVFTYFDGARSYQYTVELSEDGENWTLVADKKDQKQPAIGSGDTHDFTPIRARYVRVNLLKNSANIAVHLNEVQVFEAE